MASDRENNSVEKPLAGGRSGMAMAMAMVIMLGTLLLIAGVYYLLRGGWRIAVINKQFSTVQEAAAGGVEHSAEVIRLVNNAMSTGNMGLSDPNNSIYLCSQSSRASLAVKTADGKYQINMTVRCLGKKPIPGAGGALIFPPPPSYGSGGMPSYYVFYGISSQGISNDNGSVAKVDAVYRFAR